VHVVYPRSFAINGVLAIIASIPLDTVGSVYPWRLLAADTPRRREPGRSIVGIAAIGSTRGRWNAARLDNRKCMREYQIECLQ
jgi:hypothetical protein